MTRAGPCRDCPSCSAAAPPPKNERNRVITRYGRDQYGWAVGLIRPPLTFERLETKGQHGRSALSAQGAQAMKLRRRSKPERQTAAPSDIAPSPGVPVLRLSISSNTSLPEPDFKAQTEKLRHVADYDSVTSTWYNQISLDRPEWAAEVLNTLFEAARVHGTRIHVRVEPGAGGDPVSPPPA
ncbi:MAG TPA: hypothetical protein VFQ44_12095 [Streptosporangiaceae bacterium]|nr:hypothetical protein [Streptosporangiaceae bacterium]